MNRHIIIELKKFFTLFFIGIHCKPQVKCPLVMKRNVKKRNITPSYIYLKSFSATKIFTRKGVYNCIIVITYLIFREEKQDQTKFSARNTRYRSWYRPRYLAAKPRYLAKLKPVNFRKLKTQNYWLLTFTLVFISAPSSIDA